MVALSAEDCDKLNYILDIVYEQKGIPRNIRENCDNYKYDKKFQVSVDVAHVNKYSDIITILKESLPVIVDWDVFVSEYLFRVKSRPSDSLSRRDKEVLAIGDYTTSYFILATSIKYNYIPEVLVDAPNSYTPEMVEYLYDSPHKSLLLYKISDYMSTYSTEETNVMENFEPNARNLYHFLNRLRRGYSIKEAYKINDNVVTFRDVCEYLNVSSIEPYYFNKFYTEISSKDTTLDDLLNDKFASKYLSSLGMSLKRIGNYLNSRECFKLDKILEAVEDIKFDCKESPYDYEVMRDVSKSLAGCTNDTIMSVVKYSNGLIDKDIFSLYYVNYLGRIREQTVNRTLLTRSEKNVLSSELFTVSDYVLTEFIEYPIPEIIYKLPHTRITEFLECIYNEPYKVLVLYKVYQALNAYFPNDVNYWTKTYNYKLEIESNKSNYMSIKYLNHIDDENDNANYEDYRLGLERHVLEELREVFPFVPDSKNVCLFFLKAAKGKTFEECCEVDYNNLTFLEVSKMLDITSIPPSLFISYYNTFKRSDVMTEEKIVRNKRLKNYLSYVGQEVRHEYVDDIRDRSPTHKR